MKESKNGKKVNNNRPRINDLTRALVIRLYQENDMTCEQIAKACNISLRSVFRIVKKN